MSYSPSWNDHAPSWQHLLAVRSLIATEICCVLPWQCHRPGGQALYNLGQAEGLTIWSPNVNIFRDPRWGRGQETPGEDPAVASKYAVAFVRGIQGSSTPAGAAAAPQPLQAFACCKHATAYDLEDWNGVARYDFDARVTLQDLVDTFNPPFQSCVVDGKASCVMCAYTGINGVPACASSDLLTKTFRGACWGLDGYVSSDCDAVAIMHDAQRYVPTPEDTVAVALKAGLDLNCGTYTQEHGMAAIQQGKMTEKDVDKALTNLFAVRMRLGHFDGDPRGNALSAPCGYAAMGQAAALASSSEYVFLFMGLSQDQDKEGMDRTSLLLLGKQQSLITAVASVAKRPVILVLLTGGPVDITFAQSNPKIGTILNYRFYRGKTIYKFKYGLSYSKFSRQLVTGGKNQLAPNTSLLSGLSAMTKDATSYYHVNDIGVDGCEQLKFPAEVEV
ncbi:unnamed protein product [Miscanthus lutarioriparius]|uniref:Glycoside hydrolase family 3 N-terminal domain-containing protein n=1 Tax=Miscanthus lutarioriparius TaxID=422564 RepID=A0A811QMI9_9POAL|nr:unnamed protein product [Miscanthus lutarioriparius]